jgi:hypothetical protein
MVCAVQRIGVTLCLMALAAIQIPWIVCTGCCEDVSMSAVRVHECHVHAAEDTRHAHHDHHDHGCACEQGGDETPDHEHRSTEHYLVQIPAVASGAPVVLPDHLPTGATVAAADLPSPAAAATWTSAHDPPEASLAVPRGASERLLL